MNKTEQARNKIEQTRQVLLNVAEDLFFEKGVSRTSLEMIARAGGVPRGAVYWQFSGKSEILSELLALVRPTYDEIEKRLSSDEQNYSLIELFDFCVNHLSTYIAPGRARRVMTILIYKCELTQELSDFQKRERSRHIETVALYERVFETNKCSLQPGITPKSASLQLHLIFDGLLRSALRDCESFGPIFDVRLVFSLYFKSILKNWI